MDNRAPTLLVAIVDTKVLVKVSGRATFNSSLDFKTLVQQLRERGYHHFVLDLGDCLMMDSTFLGVLAGLGQRIMAASPNAGTNGRIQLLRPNQRVHDLLENLGVTHLFTILRGTDAALEQCQPVAPSAANHTREEVTRTCLEAHHTLMDLNPENVGKFKDVARFLAEDLARLEREPR